MSIRRHSEAQIIEALKQTEAWRTASDLGSALGVSKQHNLLLKAKHGLLEITVSDYRYRS